MTSYGSFIMNSAKLKRKLGNLGVDTSSRRANENFCLVIPPLPLSLGRLQSARLARLCPPLEKSKDTGEFVPL